jgi:hypothetical protein
MLMVSIETSTMLIAITGPSSPKASLLNKPEWPIPFFSINSNELGFNSQKRFPLFFEEVDYQLEVVSKTPGSTPEISNRNPAVLRDFKVFSDAVTPTVFGTMRFRQSIGLSTFQFLNGDNRVDLTIEVFPSKLDYMDDYFAMLDEIRAFDRLLPLRYFLETFRFKNFADTENPSALDWITILRGIVSDLAAALIYAEKHPIADSDLEDADLRPDQILHVDSWTRAAIRQGLGRGESGDRGIGIPMKRVVPSFQKTSSLDNPEHRWIRTSLDVIVNRLRSLRASLSIEASTRREFRTQGNHSSNENSGAVISDQVAEIDLITQTVSGMQSLKIVREASARPVHSNFTSIRLLRRPGYSEAYRAIQSLRMGLNESFGPFEVSVDRISKLYESWCFIELAKQIEAICGSPIDIKVQPGLISSSLGTQLATGKQSQIIFNLQDGRTLLLGYNVGHSSPTGTHVPDIQILIRKPGWQDVLLLFDAKYRLDTSNDSSNFYGILSPPQDAISALHRYRDAIVLPGRTSEDPFFRPVVWGAALYPLGESESFVYPKTKLNKALQIVGIGAIPFLPGNIAHVNVWLQQLLSFTHLQLTTLSPPSPRGSAQGVASSP